MSRLGSKLAVTATLPVWRLRQCAHNFHRTHRRNPRQSAKFAACTGRARKEFEAAGFRLAEEGNFLRNPNDPRDKNTPDPAQPKDEFVLKFVKP